MHLPIARRTLLATGLAAGLTLAAAAPATSQDLTAPDELVSKAPFTVQKIAAEEKLKQTVPALLRRARGVLIFPSLLKGAFIIGAEGGSGVLMTRDQSGSWSHPAFYTMGSVSLGLQIGGQASEAMLIIMTDKGLQSVLEDQVKLGAGVSAAAGPVGIGAEAATTMAVGADIYTYSTAQGAFIGASLDGAVIARREDWNRIYYGQDATPRAIVIDRRFGNPKSNELREVLDRYSR